MHRLGEGKHFFRGWKCIWLSKAFQETCRSSIQMNLLTERFFWESEIMIRSFRYRKTRSVPLHYKLITFTGNPLLLSKIELIDIQKLILPLTPSYQVSYRLTYREIDEWENLCTTTSMQSVNKLLALFWLFSIIRIVRIILCERH